MKWYIWAAIAVALIVIIYFVTKKKSTSNSNMVASNEAPQQVLSSGFNPYQLTHIG